MGIIDRHLLLVLLAFFCVNGRLALLRNTAVYPPFFSFYPLNILSFKS